MSSWEPPRNEDGSIRTRADEEATPGMMGWLYRAGHGVSDLLDGKWPGSGAGGSGSREEETPVPETSSWSPPRNDDGSIRTRADEEAEGGLTGMLYRGGHAISDGLDWLFGD